MLVCVNLACYGVAYCNALAQSVKTYIIFYV